jgi:hypothetical protein
MRACARARTHQHKHPADMAGIMWCRLCAQCQAERVKVCAGLDNAGKSTLLHKLCNQEVRAFVPTTKAHAKTFSLGSITFTAWDLGGHEQVRHV